MMRKRLSPEIGVLLLALYACLFWPRVAIAQKPSVKPVNQVVVVDSKGKVVGHALGGLGVDLVSLVGDLPFEPTVLLKVDERLIAVKVAKDFFYTGFVFFEFENCQGTPWLSPNFSMQSLLLRSAIGPPGNIVYVPRVGAVSQQTNIRSVSFHGECHESSPREAIAAEPLINLDTVFSPPFSVRATP